MRSTKHCSIRQLTALILLTMMLLSSLPTAEASNVDDSLVVGIQSIKTPLMYPLNPQERDMISVYDMMYEGLVTIDDNYMPQPCLAQSWQESNGGRTWTFHLRQDVFFSDGTPLTANDVVASVQYILGKAANEDANDRGFYRNLNYFISSINATNEYTVTVKAKRKYYGLLYAMNFPVLKASEVESANPVGTGPYFLSSFDPGNYINLEVNPLWWRQQPQVKHLTFLCHKTPGEVIESYQYARVDAMFSRSLAASQYKTGVSNVTITSRTNQMQALIMNESASPLNDVRVRQAIRSLLDVDSLSIAYTGMVTRTDLPAIPGTWTYNEDLYTYFQQNVSEALQLLDDAGWEDLDGDGVRDKEKADGSGLSRLHLRLYVYEEPENDTRVQAATLIASMLQAGGIEVQLQTLTYSNMQAKLSAGSYDLALVSYAMDACPDPSFLLSKSNTGNYMRYNSQQMNELCDKLRTETTFDGYKNTLFKIEALFARDCPMICLFYRNGVVLTRKMYTTVRDVQEYHLLRGIETFGN